jgi:hypothetical protein
MSFERERNDRPRRQPWPVGAWIALVGAASFGVALAIMVGIKMFASPPEVAQVNPTPAPAPAPTPENPETPPIAAVLPTPPPEPENPEPETPATTGGGGGGHTRRGTGTAPTKTPNDGLTDAQRRLLEQASDGLDRPIGIGGVRGPGEDNVGPRRAALDENAIRTVVTRNRRQLQSCYEIAIRGRSDPPTVRINVTVAIGSSGTVTRASAAGNDFGGLVSCLERSVRRWRFPASNEATETTFPVVFQPGAAG